MTTETAHFEPDTENDIAYEDHLTALEPVHRKVLTYVPHNVQAVGRFDDTYLELHLETSEQREFATMESLDSASNYTPRFGVVDRVTTVLVEAKKLAGDPLSGTVVESFSDDGERITVDWTYGTEAQPEALRYAVSVAGRWFRVYDHLGLADAVRTALLDAPADRRRKIANAVEQAFWAYVADRSDDWFVNDLMPAYDRAIVVYRALGR
jgi:hypothetical protein